MYFCRYSNSSKGRGQSAQIFLYVLIKNFSNLLALSSVQHKLSSTGTVAMLCIGAFLFIYQMPILVRYHLSAVVDLIQLTGCSLWFKGHHTLPVPDSIILIHLCQGVFKGKSNKRATLDNSFSLISVKI